MEHDSPSRSRALLPRILVVTFAVSAGCALIAREHWRAQPGEVEEKPVADSSAEPVAVDDAAVEGGGDTYLMGTKGIQLPGLVSEEEAQVFLPSSKSLSIAPAEPEAAGEGTGDFYMFSSKSAPIQILEPEDPAPEEPAPYLSTSKSGSVELLDLPSPGVTEEARSKP